MRASTNNCCSGVPQSYESAASIRGQRKTVCQSILGAGADADWLETNRDVVMGLPF
jgi:hypothetical protein